MSASISYDNEDGEGDNENSLIEGGEHEFSILSKKKFLLKIMTAKRDYFKSEIIFFTYI